jgi:imidazolonepropionase-like amidohydrolase
MNRLTPIAVALVTLFSTQSASAELLAVQCGKLFDSASGRMTGPKTIVVEGSRIKQVLDGITTVSDAKVVDLGNMSCSPGFIDLHVHLSDQSSPSSYSDEFRLNVENFAYRSVGFSEKTLMAGFTSVRDLGGSIIPALRDSVNQGLVRGPRIWAAGKAIGTTGGHADPTNGYNAELSHIIGPPGPTDGVINGTDDARQAVRQRYKEGSDVIKITATGGVLSYAKSGDAPQFTIEEIQAVVETANDYGYKVAAHAHGKEGMKRAVIGGVTSIEHGTYMDEEVMTLMKKNGTWYVPTISAGRFVADKAKIDGYFPDVVRPKAARIGAQIQTTAANAYKAGVPIAFGTDAGVGPHGDNAKEFVFMVEAGMPASYALQAATFNAAKVIGTTDIGQVKPGMYADIVAMSKDPTQDINTTLNVAFVMKDGVVYKGP